MHKPHHRKLRHALRPRYLLAAAGICLLVGVVALRANNEHMANLRSAVYAADKNNGDVRGALHNLQAYVTAHMNTDLSTGNAAVYPPIQLQYTYQRLQEQAAAKSTNGDLYTQAQVYCQQQNSTDFSGRNRVPCIEQYVQSHGAAAPPAIPASLYEFDFVSPKWSPDVAGWSLVLTAVFGVGGLLLLVLGAGKKHS